MYGLLAYIGSKMFEPDPHQIINQNPDPHPDPDPHQRDADPQHCIGVLLAIASSFLKFAGAWCL